MRSMTTKAHDLASAGHSEQLWYLKSEWWQIYTKYIENLLRTYKVK